MSTSISDLVFFFFFFLTFGFLGFSFFNVFCFVLLGLNLDRLGIEDFEVEDEVQLDFPCPYCYDSLSVWGFEKDRGGGG